MSPAEYWGKLISSENPTQPTPLFTSLLLSIADYTIRELEPLTEDRLTPAKIASFYHAVGGDLDELFIDTPPDKLSSIYTTLGCAHSLEPGDDDFVPPSIPALTTRGFTIWQTIQLLLDPGEHVPYLQEAVRKLPLRETISGDPFPREIPASAFPSKPDPETQRWHDDMFARKRAADERAAATAARTGVVNMQAAGGEVVGSDDELDGGYTKYEQYGGGYRRKRHSRSRHKDRKAKYTDPDVLEAHSRSAPGTGSESYGVPRSRHRHHHSYGGHGHRHKTKVGTPYSSDEELYSSTRYSSQSRGHSRHHSAKGVDFPKSYIYANGDTLPIYPSGDSPERRGKHHRSRHYDNESPDLHSFPSQPNLHSFHGQPALSSSFEDFREALRPRHHRSSSPLASSSPPIRASPLGPTSAGYFYDELGAAPVELDSDDELASGGGWALHEERSRDMLQDEYERERDRARRRGPSREEVERDRRHRRALRETQFFEEDMSAHRPVRAETSWASIPSTHGTSRLSSAGARYRGLGVGMRPGRAYYVP